MHNQEPSIEKLVSVFDELFLLEENTCLQMGAHEPFYQSSRNGSKAIIFAREDYFSSALHEIAHWTIAGIERRKRDDFGYWYKPEGRTKAQQVKFEQVEIKPQAIEWLLSLACQQEFHLSADNLSADMQASQEFESAVREQALLYLNRGLPRRAQVLFQKLCLTFRPGDVISNRELTNV